MTATIVVGVVTGIVTGICAALLSIWQARVLRLWERREASYLEILDALQAMYRINSEWYDAELQGRDIPEAKAEMLRNTWQAEKKKLERHADLGAFLTSTDAEEILTRLSKALDKRYNTWFEDLDESRGALRDALAAVKKAAIADRRRVPLAIFKTRKL